MATVIKSRKAATVNPLKMSQPLGAALAFLGLAKCMPVMHGSQGCTSFGLVLFVRHFREAIPLQTTAMNEVTTILGGLENIEQAILNVASRAKPEIICIASTGLTEAKGDDVDGYLKLLRAKHPEWSDLAIIHVSTPDFKDAFQDGWAKAVTRLIDELTATSVPASREQINLLPGCHLTPADIEEVREIIEAFGMNAVVVPDISGSLDGHIPDTWAGTTIGGTPLQAIRELGTAVATIAIGEQMAPAATLLAARTAVPSFIFDRLTGLAATDKLMSCLAQVTGTPVPLKYRRQRSQLQDAMLDGHFYFGGRRVALGAEPDLLYGLGMWLTEMGAEIAAAVTTTQSSLLEKLPVDEVLIGDLEDLEQRAQGCDMLITHAHGRQAAARLQIPFFRAGLPCFDRLGAGHRLSVGYRGTRNLIFDVGNLFIEHDHHAEPHSWPLPEMQPAATPQLETV